MHRKHQHQAEYGTTTDTHGRTESDNHADTNVAGANMLCLAFTDQTCDVAPFSDQYEPMQGVPIVTACTAYDNPTTGETVILIFHQALWMGGRLPHSLICPNQVSLYGMVTM